VEEKSVKIGCKRKIIKLGLLFLVELNMNGTAFFFASSTCPWMSAIFRASRLGLRAWICAAVCERAVRPCATLDGIFSPF
jgi:hypothetical protein